MTTRAALVAAIEAVEQAKEGSRELSDTILLACGWTKHWEESEFAAISGWQWYDASGEPQADRPDVSCSIDAALTLVPEGSVWHVMTDYGDLNRAKVGPAGRPSATVYNSPNNWKQEIFIQGDAATPAIALCLAALRARLALLDATPAPNPPAPPLAE